MQGCRCGGWCGLKKYRSFSLIVGGQRVQAASTLSDDVAQADGV